MAQIGEKKREWFRKYLPYDNSIPKAGTYRDVLCRLNPDEVHDALIAWRKDAVETLQATGVIAVDGKTAKGSKTGTQRPAHVVSAFSSAANLAIGQIACNVLRETPGLKGSFRFRQLEYLLDDQMLSGQRRRCVSHKAFRVVHPLFIQ